MSRSPDLVVAVLAAGASRRLGRAKQAVPIGGEPLLRRQCRCALAANVGKVVVILGFNADEHRSLIQDLPVDVRVNDNWDEGLAATLCCAVRAAQMQGSALLVLPCDQYRIVPEDLGALCHRWRLTPSKACVSRAGGYAGPPVILPVEYHERICRLRGDIGARSLIYGSSWPLPEEVVNLHASFDLDSPADLRIAEMWARQRSA
jgi:molybdenum cofactor cytidylyltransferase